MIDPTFYAPLATAAEQAGYDSMVVPDSIMYPAESDSTYPYTDDGNREFLEGKPFIEPFTLIPYLAAVTEKLRFTTFVVKLPIRNPVIVAKQVTSLGVITGDRFGFGFATRPQDHAVSVLGRETVRRADADVVTGDPPVLEGRSPAPGEGGSRRQQTRHDTEQRAHCGLPSRVPPS